MSSLRRLAAQLTVVVPFAALFAVGCEHSPSMPGVLASITIAPNPDTLATTTSSAFVAIARDADGTVVGIEPTWSVMAGGGTISNAGLFTAGETLGTFDNTVMASVGSLSATATVTVIAGPLASITLTPTSTTLAVNGTQQFTAVGRDARGNAVNFAPTWSVVNGGGSVDATGLFTAGTAIGEFANTLQASSGGITATATVTVTPGPLASINVTPDPTTLSVGLTRVFSAVGRDAQGNEVAITPTWSVVAGGGTILGSGLFTAGSTPGTYTNTVRAAVGGVTGTATVTVTSGALASISVTPNPATMGIGETQQFTAVGRDAGGNVVDITPTWAVVAGGGSVDLTTGLFSAGSVSGTDTHTGRASGGGLAGFATVNVTSGALATISVSPSPVSVQTNGVQQFIAVGRDGSGNEFLITPTWSVVNGGGSVNSNTGLFTAGTTAGTFNNTVQATSGGISGSATVTVTAVAPSLATITVTPDPANLLPNATQQFSAIGRDGDGNLFPISPSWSVANGGGVINVTTGLFTAGALEGTFDETVTASSGIISGTATVVVGAGTPAPTVDLGAAEPNGIMAGTEVTCVSNGLISADVSISPGSTVTGFPPCVITPAATPNSSTCGHPKIPHLRGGEIVSVEVVGS